MTDPSPPRGVLWAGAGLAGLTAWAYSNSLRVPFVFDDGSAILDNPSIRDWRRIGAILRPAGGTTAGRPLVNLSLAANFFCGGLAPRGYHAVNLGVHILAALALFGLVRRTLLLLPPASRPGQGALPLAAVTAALWSLHPLQTQSVTYISERAESMAGLFCLLALYFFVRSVPSARPGPWLAGSVAACFCGVASKEVAVTAPVLVLLVDCAFAGGSIRGAWNARRGYYLALASSWLLLAFLMTDSSLGSRGVGFSSGVSVPAYAGTEMRALVTYVRLSLWPHPLVFDYGAECYARNLRDVLPFALLVFSGVAAAVWAWARSRMLGFLPIAFLVLLAPTSSVVPVALDPVSESRMYLPLATLAAAAVLAVPKAGGRRSLAVLAALAAVLGVLTFQRNRDYRTELDLWSDTVAKRPDSSRAQTQLGAALARAGGRSAEAIARYRAALRINPNLVEALTDLADERAREPDGRGEAIASYEKALRLDPGYAEAHNNLANLLARNPAKAPEAMAHYRTALGLRPDLVEARSNLATLLGRQPGMAGEAVAQFRETLRLAPDYFEAHNNLANLLARDPGRLTEAIAEYEAALRLRPDVPETHFNLAAALARTPGGRPAAIEHYRRALSLRPDFAAARAHLEALEAGN